MFYKKPGKKFLVTVVFYKDIFCEITKLKDKINVILKIFS